MLISKMYDHELRIFILPSPGVNWASPASLALSTAFYKLGGWPRAIGHVTINIESSGVGLEPISIHTGICQAERNEGRAEILRKGYGLGILFHDFKGMLESKDDLEQEIAGRMKRGNLSFIKIGISRGAAERMAEFLKQFRDKRACDHYGSAHRPLYAEGAGCATFAAAFLEIAGLLEQEYVDSWIRHRRLPLTHIGGPKTGTKVSFLKMLTCMKWAEEKEPHEKLALYDPDLMHEWVMKTIQTAQTKEAPKFRVEKVGNTYGVVFDRQEMHCPNGEILRSEQDRLRTTR